AVPARRQCQQGGSASKAAVPPNTGFAGGGCCQRRLLGELAGDSGLPPSQLLPTSLVLLL
ncbi:hypothetical protein SK571_46290, partial [Lentzea sp. BCCO 10_0798]